MPNIWTHLLFCEELITTLENPAHYTEFQAHTNIGAQGPDPFFITVFGHGSRMIQSIK